MATPEDPNAELKNLMAGHRVGSYASQVIVRYGNPVRSTSDWTREFPFPTDKHEELVQLRCKTTRDSAEYTMKVRVPEAPEAGFAITFKNYNDRFWRFPPHEGDRDEQNRLNAHEVETRLLHILGIDEPARETE